jgi:hypothetical protein
MKNERHRSLNGLQAPALRASSIRCSYPELTLGAIQYRRFAPQLPILFHRSDGRPIKRRYATQPFHVSLIPGIEMPG